MLEKYEITEVTRTRIGLTECWQVRQLRPDGEHHIAVFPAATLEWRAAEYDIDHTTKAGLDQILDIVLHEPFLPDPLQDRDQDPAAAKGLTAPSTQALHGLAVGDQAPVTLHNAPDRATARAAHLERIAHLKRTGINVVSPTPPTRPGGLARAAAPDPLDLIRAGHGITAAGVTAKTALVEQARQHLAAARSETAPPASTPADLLAAFTAAPEAISQSPDGESPA
ncbi:hypothetical protein ACIRBX_25120 [Kitasatospora sp. NPDC096147]|uniref:hypothetical protein n=1 Tax=Kitasatospora sp. NPDC096147 TaxID=3364093 RepID=UPI00382F0ED2